MARRKRFELLTPEFAACAFRRHVWVARLPGRPLDGWGSKWSLSTLDLATAQLIGASPLQMLPATLLQAHNKLHNMTTSRPRQVFDVYPFIVSGSPEARAT